MKSIKLILFTSLLSLSSAYASAKETPVASSKETPVASSKETPVASSKETPVASSKETPVASKETPVASKETPVASKETPASSKETPVASKETPVASEETPVASKETPASSKETPVASKETPVASKETPVASKETPASSKETPVASKETPVASKETPASSKETPVASKETPASSKETPVASKETPVASKETPAASKETPVASKDVHWSYQGDEGPEFWGHLADEYSKCQTGKEQSPINITKVNKNDKEVSIKGHYQASINELVNNGHTIQVSPKNADSYLNYKDEKYFLKQFHFHIPSENHIENQSFPLEAHFVHSTKDGKLLVLAVMFKEGKNNPEFKKILASVPKELNKTADMKVKIDLKKMIPSTKHFYHFMGSLTTPPCSEDVTWIVLKDKKSLSKSQLKALEKILKHHNNRPIQPLNNREVNEFGED